MKAHVVAAGAEVFADERLRLILPLPHLFLLIFAILSVSDIAPPLTARGVREPWESSLKREMSELETTKIKDKLVFDLMTTPKNDTLESCISQRNELLDNGLALSSEFIKVASRAESALKNLYQKTALRIESTKEVKKIERVIYISNLLPFRF
jgi:hypothetical protein